MMGVGGRGRVGWRILGAGRNDADDTMWYCLFISGDGMELFVVS